MLVFGACPSHRIKAAVVAAVSYPRRRKPSGVDTQSRPEVARCESDMAEPAQPKGWFLVGPEARATLLFYRLDRDLYHLRTVVPVEVSSKRKHSAKASIEVTIPASTGADKLLPVPVS